MRSNSGFGLNPIGAVGIQAWSSLTGTQIEPWEGTILLDMDRARIAGPEEAIEAEAPATQAFTAQVFDALFPF